MALVTQSAFAASHGVSRKTVTKWKQADRLVFVGDQVDIEASDACLRGMGLGKFARRPRPLPAVDTPRPGNPAGNNGARSQHASPHSVVALAGAEEEWALWSRRRDFSPDAFLILNVAQTVWPGLMQRAVLHFGGSERAAALAAAALSELVGTLAVELHDLDNEAGLGDYRAAFSPAPPLDWSPAAAAGLDAILEGDPGWFSATPEGTALSNAMFDALDVAKRSISACRS